MSVYKFHQALVILDYLDRNNIPLSTEIFVDKSSLLPNTYSPLREEKPEGNYYISIKTLLSYSVSKSDNNACDILFQYIGGPNVVDHYIKNLGITGISINATEKVMNENVNGNYPYQYLNWTTPSASALLMSLFLNNNLLSSTYQKFLETILIETETGANKIKAGLPVDVIVGHKTGSSARNNDDLKIAENDMGFIQFSTDEKYILAVFIMNSYENDIENADIIAQISRSVYNYYKSK